MILKEGRGNWHALTFCRPVIREQRPCEVTFCSRCHDAAGSVHRKNSFSSSLISRILYTAPSRHLTRALKGMRPL